jgi:sulfopyruvate decarboxylase TPP-binding subunit
MSVEAEAEGKTVHWQDEVYELLRRNDVTQFAYVPDPGHRILIDRSLADPEVHSVALTTEEEGIALLAGADLGGARGVLLLRRRQLHQHVVAGQRRAVSVLVTREHAR